MSCGHPTIIKDKDRTYCARCGKDLKPDINITVEEEQEELEEEDQEDQEDELEDEQEPDEELEEVGSSAGSPPRTEQK